MRDYIDKPYTVENLEKLPLYKQESQPRSGYLVQLLNGHITLDQHVKIRMAWKLLSPDKGQFSFWTVEGVAFVGFEDDELVEVMFKSLDTVLLGA